ncbi:hypothetical protein HMPREF9140_00120 [Prevotella micans F0438]|uniref:Uncharacterized protein n=2 Tax=Prevotella micans TaxID=189723 RepID=H1PZN2_9BACT|nr:hypothetical protein [Prevotella micans]EHO75077.1 hypothetical protein HMPREF9140_00120 [Prevotella micans F0438]
MKKLLSLLFCLMAVHVSTAQTADFSVPNSDGVTLYYNITDATQHTVEVTNYYGQVALASLGGTVSWGSYIRYTTPVLRPLQNSSYNLSFLNIFCTFMV